MKMITGFFILLILLMKPALAQQNKNIKPLLYEEYHNQALDISAYRRKRQINIRELLQMKNEQNTVLIDVRNTEHYNWGHIQGAINISLTNLTRNNLKQHIDSPETRILIYCSNGLSPIPTRAISLTHEAFPMIYSLGYKNIYELEEAWGSKYKAELQAIKYIETTSTETNIQENILRLNKKPLTKQDCQNAGGEWGRFGLLEIDDCDVPTHDAGKECTDHSQCESVCIADEKIPSGTQTKGQCYSKSITRGTCLNYVNDGKVEGVICGD